MIVVIAAMSSQRADQVGAEAPGFVYGCTGFYAEGFGLIASGNCASGIGFDRNNRNRFAAQLGTQLLLDARKAAVEIEIQPAQAQRGYGIIAHGHSSFYGSDRYRSTDYEE